MIRIFLAMLAVVFLQLGTTTTTNAGPHLLSERILPTCGGGHIEHVVATTTENDVYLIFTKVATDSKIESYQEVVSMAELQRRRLIDDQIIVGTYKVVRAMSCGGTGDCSSMHCDGSKKCVSGTSGCKCKKKDS